MCQFLSSQWCLDHVVVVQESIGPEQGREGHDHQRDQLLGCKTDLLVMRGGDQSSQLGIHKQTNACWNIPRSQRYICIVQKDKPTAVVGLQGSRSAVYVNISHTAFHRHCISDIFP